MANRGTLELLIGPVGAGKSTFARRLAASRGGVFLDVDTWMVRLYGGDTRPNHDVLAWYLERRERCRELVWDTMLDVVATGTAVLLELGLVTRVEREACYARARADDLTLRVYLADAPREVRRQRVAARNVAGGAHVQIVPPTFFERASDLWEPVAHDERSALAIVDL